MFGHASDGDTPSAPKMLHLYRQVFHDHAMAA